MKTLSYVAAALALVAASPVLALETLNATFTVPDGGITARAYSGDVRVTVSGVGQSQRTRFNDAFYLFSPTPIEHDKSYYQLTFSTATLVPLRPRTQDAVKAIVGGVPAYNASHIYSFILNTGTNTPKKLHFGVSDGIFVDNTGSYLITIAVPEPATWGMMLAGFALVGVALRRRTRGVVVAA